MLVLGIETSAALCSISWVMHGQILLEYNIEQPNIHTQILADLVAEGFNRIGKTPANVDLICVASGPGSFTGLRIGMAYAKGMAYALDKPIVAVTNFEVLAQNSVLDKFPVYTVIDARRDNYYLGIFKSDTHHADITVFCDQTELIKYISHKGTVVTTIKDFKKRIKTNTDIILTRYSAATIAISGQIKYEKGRASEDINQIEPLYLRKFAGAT